MAGPVYGVTRPSALPCDMSSLLSWPPAGAGIRPQGQEREGSQEASPGHGCSVLCLGDLIVAESLTSYWKVRLLQ